jgi:2-methylcitrate dehydratase PrpD
MTCRCFDHAPALIADGTGVPLDGTTLPGEADRGEWCICHVRQTTGERDHNMAVTADTLAEQLAAFTRSAMDDGVPRLVQTNTLGRVIDIVGLSVAASTLPTSIAARGLVIEQGGRADASIVDATPRVPAAQAAFVNGVLAHSLDFDDTHLPSILHPSASIVPAALAIAEQVDAPGDRLMAAIAIGIEVCVRVGMVGFDVDRRESEFFARGQHATSMCGTIGSAAAAAALLDLDESSIVDSLGIAASFASGLLEGNRTGGTVKRMHCGWAASAGVTAAQLAQRGITGPTTVFEGRFGFFEALIGRVINPAALTDGLGEHWEVPGVFFKPYPANHFTHCAADAAMGLRESGIRLEDIEQLHIGVAGSTVRTIGEPIDVKRRPETGYQGQFSGPYVVTAALEGGAGLGLGMKDFTDKLVTDPRRVDFMQRITVGADPKCEEVYPYQFPAVVTAQLFDGSRVVEERMVNRGGSELPLTPEELAQKFTQNVTTVTDRATADDLYRRLQELPGLAGVRAQLGNLQARVKRAESQPSA